MNICRPKKILIPTDVLEATPKAPPCPLDAGLLYLTFMNSSVLCILVTKIVQGRQKQVFIFFPFRDFSYVTSSSFVSSVSWLSLNETRLSLSEARMSFKTIVISVIFTLYTITIWQTRTGSNQIVQTKRNEFRNSCLLKKVMFHSVLCILHSLDPVLFYDPPFIICTQTV